MELKIEIFRSKLNFGILVIPHVVVLRLVTTRKYRSPRGGGDSHMEQTGMLVANFEFNP